MSQHGDIDPKSPQAMLHMLCRKFTGLKGDAVTPYYKLALTTLGSNITAPTESDEFAVVEKIKKKLARQHREKDAAIFSELYRKFQSHELLKNKWSLLYFLMRLGEDQTKKSTNKVGHRSFIQGLTTQLTSTPFAAQGTTPAGYLSENSAGSSGISSIHASNASSRSITPKSLHPSAVATPYTTQGGWKSHFQTPGQSLSHALQPSRSADSMVQSSSAITRSRKIQGDNNSFELPESVLLREIVYIFQGIEGKHIHYEIGKDGFCIDEKVGVPRAASRSVGKLAECGWLYNKVRKYADSRSSDRAFGLVGQSFCAALHQELTEYYRLIAVLESQLEQEGDQGVHVGNGGLTLRRLVVWTCEPMVRLKALAALVHVCQGKKGGALASAIHSYIQHGDPLIQALVRHTLTLVAQPIFNTLMKWIYYGELEDTYHEFFVASDPTVKDENLWHEKYSLRKSMIPSFLTPDQAKKILLTGKSINFLRQVCHDRASMRNRDSVKMAETHQVESIFSQEADGVFQKMIDTVYKETSHHLLHVLHHKYKFLEHLKAMRRYLLLGQGDFIRHLMDLLEEDLGKPASMLYLHNLTGIVETAIRATNAQYDDPDILKRVDVRTLESSPGESGWDVFSLDYHVDGPIRTVFTHDSMIMYLRIYNFLWRAKRMEYILAGIWKSQCANARMLRPIPELGEVLHHCQCIGSQMVHFIQQIQYYINFEVLECSWDELLRKVSEAEDLDDIILAHNHFLHMVTARCLLGQDSSAILTQLRTTFDLIIQFQTIQDSLYQTAEEELTSRQQFSAKKTTRTDKGNWGVTDAEEVVEERRQKDFKQSKIPSFMTQLHILQASYQEMVQKFLLMLATQSDESLRFLSVRLDFNEFYKVRDTRRTSLHAERQRQKLHTTSQSVA